MTTWLAYQLRRAVERRDRAQHGPEVLVVQGAYVVADRVLGRVARHVRDQSVAAHADGAADVIERHRDPGLAERIDPRLRVRIVAVDQRAVDVQDHGAA